MAENEMKTSTKVESMVQFLNDDEVKAEMGEAFASTMLNPTVTWAKFILTDDRTNANGERVPQNEFQNLMRSGIHMPVKMALGEISQGHPGTKPLGTITHLKEIKTEDGASAIVALAALWGGERPADVEFIKQRFAEKQPVDVSWEILYEDAVLNTVNGSVDLMGTVLRAATIVGNPAYTGRTPFLSIAARKISEATTDNDPDNNAEDELNEIEKLQADLAEAQRKLDEATKLLAEKEISLSEKVAEVTRLTEEKTAQETELTSLKEFKDTIDAENAKKEKLANVKTKFVEAGIEKGDEYFNDNTDKLIAMSDEQLDFMLQELKVFAEAASKTSTASKNKTKIPVLTGNEEVADEKSPKELGKALREQRGKK